METSQASSEGTLQGDSTSSTKPTLDLSSLPPIFISTTHLETDELHELEDQLVEARGQLTYDIQEARIVLTCAERQRRILLDLRTKNCFTEEVTNDGPELDDPAIKRRKGNKAEEIGKDEEKAVVIDDSSTSSETEEIARDKPISLKRKRKPSPPEKKEEEDIIQVLGLSWLEDCLKRGTIMPFKPYLKYKGRRIPNPEPGNSKPPITLTTPSSKHQTNPQAILERARADATATTSSSPLTKTPNNNNRRLGQIGGTKPTLPSNAKPRLQLLHQTTSEHDLGHSSDIPCPPSWVLQNQIYSCQRITPSNPPNATFIYHLETIKLGRLLLADEIGVRAYSTSIASLSSYPYTLSSPREILTLPGCDVKLANLFVEFANTGSVKEATDVEENEDLKILKTFYDVWGVGAATAREFLFARGWRDLDDVVEYGWSTLTRVQQIGVKFYHEFLLPIPRDEVKGIAEVIHDHAVKVRDNRIQSLIVGGYRRGKANCGDVDVMISHPEEKETLGLVTDVVRSLEDEGWITHTLVVGITSSNRDQQTLPLRSDHSSASSGFDTLDKALVVWQDPNHVEEKEKRGEYQKKKKNPNTHRRVDIIISPWKTVGCAVLGWTGGTTFERDLRRFVRKTKNWKFDSSGVRDRATGRVVDVDGFGDGNTKAKTMEEAEKRVFENVGLEWREPWERWTG